MCLIQFLLNQRNDWTHSLHQSKNGKFFYTATMFFKTIYFDAINLTRQMAWHSGSILIGEQDLRNVSIAIIFIWKRIWLPRLNMSTWTYRSWMQTNESLKHKYGLRGITVFFKIKLIAISENISSILFVVFLFYVFIQTSFWIWAEENPRIDFIGFHF